MKLRIWLEDEPLSDDADGIAKTWVDIEFVADTVHRHLLGKAIPPAGITVRTDRGS